MIVKILNFSFLMILLLNETKISGISQGNKKSVGYPTRCLSSYESLDTNFTQVIAGKWYKTKLYLGEIPNISFNITCFCTQFIKNSAGNVIMKEYISTHGKSFTRDYQINTNIPGEIYYQAKVIQEYNHEEFYYIKETIVDVDDTNILVYVCAQGKKSTEHMLEYRSRNGLLNESFMAKTEYHVWSMSLIMNYSSIVNITNEDCP